MVLHHSQHVSAREQVRCQIPLLTDEDATSLPCQDSWSSFPPDTLSDEFLMHALAGGAVWALEALYQRHSRLLYSLAYRMVGDYHVAENLLQEVFVAVWQRAVSYSAPLGAVRSWLIAIMRHRAIDYIRSRRCRSTAKEVTWEDAGRDQRSAWPDVWEEVWHSITRTQIRQALMRLPREQRMVIELAYFQGWTHVEIAEQYHLPLGTVKGRIRLGLLRLKRELEEQGVREL